VLLCKGEELPFPHHGRVVQTFEVSTQKEENIACLLVFFLEVDEAGMDKGQMKTTSVSSGWSESLTQSQAGGSNLLVASNGYKLLHALENSSHKVRAVTQRWVPCTPSLRSFP